MWHANQSLQFFPKCARYKPAPCSPQIRDGSLISRVKIRASIAKQKHALTYSVRKKVGLGEEICIAVKRASSREWPFGRDAGQIG